MERIFLVFLMHKKNIKNFFDKRLAQLGIDSPNELEDDKKAEFLDYVNKNFEESPMDNFIPLELKRVEFVGPQVGEELRDQGGLGMLVALFMILFYVAFRFQYKFALGAVSALGHDVVIILGLFSVFGWDFDLTVLAALLAVIGYSLNDTIVVSDRIRENFRTQRELGPQDMIDLSLNQTLGRTIVTSLTTLLVLFALFIFGGEMIKGFSLALILGVVVGTYSSIYVVANLLMSLTLTQEDLAIPEPEGADFDEIP